MISQFRFFLIFLSLQLLVPGVAWAETMQELIRAALLSHPSIRVQEALGRSADSGVSSARWQYLPTPSVGVERVAGASQSPAYGYGDSTVTTMRLQQPLWTGGRLSAGVEKAEAGVELARAEVGVARQELALRILQAYVEWHGAVLRGRAYEKSLQSHRRLQSQIMRRIKEGVSPQVDLSLVLGRIEQTQGELIVAQAQQATSLSRLGQLLDRVVSADDLLQSPAQPLVVGVVQEMLELARAGNPAVEKVVAMARMRQFEVDERRADLSPEVYLRMERQYGNFSFRGAPPENRVFLGVSTRFGAGLSVVSAIDVARGRYEAALADVDGARILLSDQIYADHLQAESGKERLQTLNASLASAEAISRAWDRQFQAGQKSWLDIMNSVREVAQVEVQIADANAAQLLVTWRLNLVARGVDALILQPATVIAGGAGEVKEEASVGLYLRLERVLRWFVSDRGVDVRPAIASGKRDGGHR